MDAADETGRFIPVGPGWKVAEFVDHINPRVRLHDMVGWMLTSEEGENLHMPCYFSGHYLTVCSVGEGDYDPYHIKVVRDVDTLDFEHLEYPMTP